MKKLLGSLGVGALMLAAVVVGPAPTQAAAPTWDTTGSYVVSFEYLGSYYAHDMSLVQDGAGALTGSGGHPAGGPFVYTWVLTSGSVSDNNVTFTANYTASADAVTPQTTMIVMGTVAPDGSMSGTWTDNYQGQARGGSWETTSGQAAQICSAAPSYAAHYLKELGIKTGSKLYKNIVSLVAKRMGPANSFDGVEACDMPDYQTVVESYVSTLLP